MTGPEFSVAAVSSQMSEASEWLVTLQEADVTEADVAAWLKWCAEDDANLEAFEQVQRLYDQLQALPLAEKRSFLRMRPASGARLVPSYFTQALAWLHEHAMPAGLVAAAGVIAVSILIARSGGTASLEVHDYRTRRGSQEVLTLADRSVVTLAGASAVSSNFTTKMRSIDLHSGEAFFEVEHDATRPFVVRAGTMTVTAVGTRFDVRTSGGRTVVAVTEGAVDVATSRSIAESIHGIPPAEGGSEASTSPLRLRAGQQAVRQNGQPGLTVVDVRTSAVSAWRQGRLEYVLEPLISVVEDVNRYSSRRILVSDAALSDMLFTGTIFVDQIDDWASTLPAAFPVAISPGSDGTLVLSSTAVDKL